MKNEKTLLQIADAQGVYPEHIQITQDLISGLPTFRGFDKLIVAEPGKMCELVWRTLQIGITLGIRQERARRRK